jgi:hypothetical protein
MTQTYVPSLIQKKNIYQIVISCRISLISLLSENLPIITHIIHYPTLNSHLTQQTNLFPTIYISLHYKFNDPITLIAQLPMMT